VDKIEDGIPNSDEMISPVEVAEPAGEPAGDEVKRADPHADPHPNPHDDLFADEKTGGDRSRYLVIGGVIGVPVVFLVIAWLGLLNYSTAVYITCLGFLPLVLWMGRKTNTVYTVFLGCIIAVLLTCVYLLWVVLGKYNFDVKAQEAKQRVGMVQPVDRGLLVATAANAANTFADC